MATLLSRATHSEAIPLPRTTTSPMSRHVPRRRIVIIDPLRRPLHHRIISGHRIVIHQRIGKAIALIAGGVLMLVDANGGSDTLSDVMDNIFGN